jgi:hypothetical protein
MPAKPMWYRRLDEIIDRLEALPQKWVDSAIVEELLGVGRRRARQIMAPCITARVGGNALANRRKLIVQLRAVAAKEEVAASQKRGQHFGQALDSLRNAVLQQPRVAVEVPSPILNQNIQNLPKGITLKPGQITVSFNTPKEALEVLAILAVAIGNNPQQFADMVAIHGEPSPSCKNSCESCTN